MKSIKWKTHKINEIISIEYSKNQKLLPQKQASHDSESKAPEKLYLNFQPSTSKP